MSAPFAVTRILCPTDFSPASEHAVRVAETIAARFDAKIDLLHVWAPPVSVALDAAVLPSADQIIQLTTALENALADAAKKVALPAGRVDRHLVQGVAWREIGAFAEEKKCDLVVMSTHGRSGIAHFVMGSVTERVARTSKVPVLVVPATV
jgi:nucleotide-binding universal stress UspA family protein